MHISVFSTSADVFVCIGGKSTSDKKSCSRPFAETNQATVKQEHLWVQTRASGAPGDSHLEFLQSILVWVIHQMHLITLSSDLRTEGCAFSRASRTKR